MPGNRRLPQYFFFIWIAATTASMACACPYCPKTDDLTLSEKLADSDAVCVVQFLESKDGEELSMQETTFQIVQWMKQSELYRPVEKIVTAFGVKAKPGDGYLLMGKMIQAEGVMDWSLPIEIDEISREYIRQAPSPEALAKSERLTYFLKFLDFPNPVMSNDAFLEFAKARFEDVAEMVRLLASKGKDKDLRMKVRRWLEDQNPQLDVRRAFYGMLLGLCGNQDDAKYLEEKILAPIDPGKIRLWVGGMMAGYFILRGEPGLQLMVKEKVDSLPVDESSDDLNSLLMTLIFLWDYRRDQFSEESLRKAMRRLLERPELAETAIVHLTRWKDWTPLKKLIEAYGRDPWETRSGKEKIVAYALMCQRDVPAASGARLPEHVVVAKNFLEQLDPDFVQSVKRNLGSSLVVKPTAKE